MATKKAAKKTGGAKKSSKKAAKKAAVGVSAGSLACIRKCHDNFLKCLQTTHNFKLCAAQYQKCIRACLNL